MTFLMEWARAMGAREVAAYALEEAGARAPSPLEDVISQPQPAGLQAAPRALVEALEEAFEGDSGARIFLQAALRMARRSTLPVDPDVLIDFVRAHLIGMLAEEIGALRATEFLEKLVATMRLMTRDELAMSASGAQESDVAWQDSAPRLRSRPSLPAVDVPIDFTLSAVPPSSAEVASEPKAPSSARHRPRIRTLLVHSDRFTRAALARHLLAAGCDVMVIESFVDLAGILEVLPTVAVVDMAAKDVDVLLAGMVTRNPTLRVLALVASGRDASRVLERARVHGSMLLPRTVRGPDLAVALRRLAAQDLDSIP